MVHFSIVTIPFRIIFLVCVLETTEQVKSDSVIFDVSQAITDVLKRGDKAGGAQNALERIISQTSKQVGHLLYYRTSIKNSLRDEIQEVINIFHKIKKSPSNSPPKLLLSFSDVTGIPTNVNTTAYIHENYAQTINLIAEHSSMMAGLSIEALYLENICDHFKNEEDYKPNPHPLTSIIPELQKFITTSSQKKLKLGYEIRINDLKCWLHSSNKNSADFVVTKIPLKRNDNYFVESYGLFKENLENELSRASKGILVNKTIYIKISLTAILERGDLHAFIVKQENQGKEIYNQREETWLHLAKDGLVTWDGRAARRYENLMTEYMREWTRDNVRNKVIITCLHGYPYFEDSDLMEYWEKKAELIPYVSNLPVIGQNADKFSIGKNKKVTLQETTDLFLKDVALSGLKTVMVAGKTWDVLSNTTITANKDFPPCQVAALCRPRTVFYLVEDDEHLKKIRSNPETIRGRNGTHVKVLVFSHQLDKPLGTLWDEVLTSFPNTNITPACQIQTHMFENLPANTPCRNIYACNAIRLRRGFDDRCLPMENITSTIIWKQTLELSRFDEADFFVGSIMNKLDSFLIGREMILKEFPGKNITLQFKGRYKDELSLTGYKTLYCNDYADRIGQFYEALLTWSLIHGFPVILEPADDTQLRFDNPLAWKKIELTPQNALQEVINVGPLLIRRGYNRSKAFGTWAKGMYPCIPKATIKTTKLNFDNGYAGVILNMGLRQHPLTPDELVTLLLFSLGKFSTVEISIQKEHFPTLKAVTLLPSFKANLKVNQIVGKTVYIQLPKGCTSNDIKTIKEIMSGFKNAGLQTNVHAPDESLDYTVSGPEMGQAIENCSAEAKRLVLTPKTDMIKMNPKFNGPSYIVCSTDAEWAYNRDEKAMQDYLTSHLYLTKILQYFYPKLKRIHFRLRPKLTNEEDPLANLIMFLSDVNNYAKGYNIHYFILSAFPTDNISQTETSFWNITNYANLTDLSVYQEHQAEFFNETIWIPEFANISEIEQNNSAEDDQDHILLYVIAGTIPLVVPIFIVAIIFWTRRSRRLSKLEVQQFYTGHQVTLKKAVDDRQNNQYTVNLFDGLVFQKEYEIPKEEIILHENIILGKGKFSTIHLATLHNVLNTAAVKIAKRSCSKLEFKEMLSEVKLLCYIGDHMNVVKFLGCYTKEIEDRVLWVVTELCKDGPLNQFLRNNRETNSIETRDMIKFSLEIASGMAYITKQKIIHGNLCTHSILLDAEGKHCKIYGCGGLWRKMGDHQKSMKRNKEPRKWQWMAPELLNRVTFSMESDVWSFGVTVWEIFTLGDIPFSKVTWSPKVVSDLKNGMRLQIPPLASNEVFNVMLDCWATEAKNRPDFSKLVIQFNNLLGKEA